MSAPDVKKCPNCLKPTDQPGRWMCRGEHLFAAPDPTLTIGARIREAVQRQITCGGRSPTRIYLGILADRQFTLEMQPLCTTTHNIVAITAHSVWCRTYDGMRIFVVADDPDHVGVA